MLLIVPLKTSRRYDLLSPLSSWIDASSVSSSTSSAPPFSLAIKSDLTRLASLRNCLSESLNTPHSHGAALADRALEDCTEYHACLVEAERRGLFPITDDDATANLPADGEKLELSWTCAFDEERRITTRSNVRYERACVLYNFAALRSYLATREDLSSREGRSRAMRLFGSAAATLSHIRKDVLASADEGGVGKKDPDPSADLTIPALLLVQYTQQAQGQLCAYQAATSRPTQLHSLLSKLACAAAELYNDALTQSQDPILKSRLPETSLGWGAHLKTMSILFRARAEWHAANVANAEQKYGDEIVRLQFAEFCCDEAIKFQGETATNASTSGSVRTTGAGVVLAREISALKRRVEHRKGEAERDNGEIYREVVPEYDDLPKIVGQSMMGEDRLPGMEEGLDPKNLERPIFAGLPPLDP